MEPPRWQVVTESQFPWERQALDYLRPRLPDHEPFRAWVNFEFVADDGSVNEVDLLLVSRSRIYLVEIKSHPGKISGDAGTWTWTRDGRTSSFDNPLLLANRKAKKLKSLLQAQRAFKKGGGRIPYIEAVVFLSNTNLDCQLKGNARAGVYLPEQTAKSQQEGIIPLLRGELDGTSKASVDHGLSRQIKQAMEQCGIRKSQQENKVGDFRLEGLLRETDLYQDWEATHVRFERSHRRVRIYPYALTTSETSRKERQKAAEREYRILDGVKHPGILQVEQFTEHERGPALVFEHPEGVERLDQWLPVHRKSLDSGTRLELIRQIAETVKFAHGNRLYHRALSPESILVYQDKQAGLSVKLFDWQSARQGTDTESSTRLSIAETSAPSYWGGNQAEAFIAPEAMVGAGYDDQRMDVFSLGCLAYYLFSETPPADSAESLRATLEAKDGLQLSDVMDAAPTFLDQLIRESTRPEAMDRLNGVDEFLVGLEEVEEELTRPDLSDQPNPLDARHKDVLEGGFTVKRRLGKGSTAVALLVTRHDGREGVLKVALEPRLNDRIEREGEALRQLRHQNVVELYDQITVSGHAALFLARAGAENKSGTETLAQRIREEGRLSLDLLQRFGDELLQVTAWLEQVGVSHRDIKPDNIGIGETPGKKLTLVLFDFSLSGTPQENIRAGTPPYLDPFLPKRRPQRWDLHAERYAVAVTLYEMATGVTPSWGDGYSDPTLTDDEVHLDTEQFDASVRDGLSRFFRKAFAREPKDRFDTAEDMRRAWFRVFENVDRPTRTTHDGDEPDLDALLAEALPHLERTTPIAELGLSGRLMNALVDRLGVNQIDDLLRLPRIRLYRNKGLGQSTVADIRNIAERLRRHFDNGDAQVDEDDSSAPASAPQYWSLDRVISRILHNRLKDEESMLLRGFLGLVVPDEQRSGGGDEERPVGEWADPRDAARRLGVSRQSLEEVLEQARERWNKHPWMSALRQDVAELVRRHGGVLTLTELCHGLIATRGATTEGDERFRRAMAVAAAASEAEDAVEKPRFVVFRGQRHTFLLGTQHLEEVWGELGGETRARYAERLGGEADRMAQEDPLLPPQRVIEVLRSVEAPEPQLPDNRLLNLAIASSENAALSSRLEVYPRGMHAERALRLGYGALIGPKALKPRDIRHRIARRYPEAEPLPDHPKLDELLERVGSQLKWDGKQGQYTVASAYTSATAGETRDTTSLDDDEQGERAAEVERKVRRVASEGRFLALRIGPRHMVKAQRRLASGYGLQAYNLEGELLRAMRDVADERRVQWSKVLEADAAGPKGPDWKKLLQVVGEAVRRMRPHVIEPPQPLLLLNPGLLVRYGHIALLNQVRDACEQGKHPGVLLLLPGSSATTMPVIDDQALPIVHASEWLHADRHWLDAPANA
ncbi:MULTISPECIES: BREX system serine/threonine kinase PglW [unclassified Halorhodospira]|uniref:BREX system serine/threonine kinase PglW n=1 Tax=unclassified Halorhodospira TaxID=2626748 RepID=UPI001EE7F518|nr:MULTISPECIES: BREX system serine/threonine kinase PglW [unclassified Halorhodospira]MCG5541815.1 BREX system serine/threonine kinase PglW [Halorhodospira sp. M39old]MCG5546902.1 BREX system serine/threonine kinase PglW [Halorhodospira sp. M38]